MFAEGDIGVLPPLGVYDPLGLIESRNMARYEVMEIKHGRAAMLGFLHVILIEAGLKFPTADCAAAPTGRAAMLGITGCLLHELLGVDALYPTGGMGGAA